MRVNVFNPISFITYYYLYICLNVNFNFFFSVKKMYAGCSSVLLAPKKIGAESIANIICISSTF